MHEVKLQLGNVASELAKDARFLASLPPIQGIVNARAGVEGDDEKVWCGRLETIFTGMLRSNPDYLSLSFEAKQGEGVADVVRVERNPADPSLVRVLPVSRLSEVGADPLMVAVETLEPGDVRLSLESRGRKTNTSASLRRLTVATPVYSDVSGECFGMAVIETDVSKQIADVLLGLGAVDSEIFVADGLGQLWMSADQVRGVQLASGADIIPDLPQPIAEAMAKQGNPFELRIQDQYVAERFYIDPTGKGVTIFARLPVDD